MGGGKQKIRSAARLALPETGRCTSRFSVPKCRRLTAGAGIGLRILICFFFFGCVSGYHTHVYDLILSMMIKSNSLEESAKWAKVGMHLKPQRRVVKATGSQELMPFVVGIWDADPQLLHDRRHQSCVSDHGKVYGGKGEAIESECDVPHPVRGTECLKDRCYCSQYQRVCLLQGASTCSL